MPDFNAWTGDAVPLTGWTDDNDRAHDTARLIAAKSSSITVSRPSGALDAQTVRLEPAGSAGEASGTNMVISKAGIVIIGYKDHPTITDTNLRRGDRFLIAGQKYSVTQVLPDIPSRLLAIAEASE